MIGLGVAAWRGPHGYTFSQRDARAIPPCFLSFAFVNIQCVIVDCEYVRGILAGIIIATVIALDAILFVRAYRANVAYKPPVRQRG